MRLETPDGSIRARASLNDSLAEDVVCGQHGWWQACDEIGAPGYDPFSPEGANFNTIIGNAVIDPISVRCLIAPISARSDASSR